MTDGRRRKNYIQRKVPVKKISDKQAQRNAEYRQFKQDNYDPHDNLCEIRVKCDGAPAVSWHHLKGRSGKNLTDRTKTKRGCLDCHQWCEEHPEEAKALGHSWSRF